MTIHYPFQTCYPCAPQDACTPFTLGTGDTIPVFSVKVFQDGNRPFDLSGYTSEATMYFTTRLYGSILAADTELRVEATRDRETWPCKGDVLFVGDSSPEMVVVQDVVDDAGTLTVERGDPARDHLETSDVRVIRAVLPGTTVATTDTDAYDGSSYLYSSSIEVAFDSVAVQAPGTYLMQIKLTRISDQRTVTLPRQGLGYPILILES